MAKNKKAGKVKKKKRNTISVGTVSQEPKMTGSNPATSTDGSEEDDSNENRESLDRVDLDSEIGGVYLLGRFDGQTYIEEGEGSGEVFEAGKVSGEKSVDSLPRNDNISDQSKWLDSASEWTQVNPVTSAVISYNQHSPSSSNPSKIAPPYDIHTQRIRELEAELKQSEEIRKKTERDLENVKGLHLTELQQITNLLRASGSNLETGDYEAWLKVFQVPAHSTSSTTSDNPQQSQATADTPDLNEIQAQIRNLQVHKRFSKWLHNELVEKDLPYEQQLSRYQQDLQSTSKKRTHIQLKLELMKTSNARDSAIKNRDATISSRDARIKFLEGELKENKKKIEILDAKEPIVQVGAAILNRFFELAKIPMLGHSREDLNKSIIEAGNKAAHGGNMVLHRLLLSTKLCTVARGPQIFRKLYRMPDTARYEDLPIWPPTLLRAVNLHATFTTINDGEGAKDLRAKAHTHFNGLFKLWHERKDKDTFESSTYARLEVSLLEKIVEEIVLTRHNYNWEGREL